MKTEEKEKKTIHTKGVSKRIIASLPKLHKKVECNNLKEAVVKATEMALVEKETAEVRVEYWLERELLRSFTAAVIRASKFDSRGIPK